MQQTGTVIAAEGGLARVRIAQSCDESRCDRCGLCGDAAARAAGLELLVLTPEPLRPGETVQLEVTFPNVALVALVVFGVPLALAILGGAAGYLIGTTGDIGVVAAGAVGLTAGFLLVAAADRHLPGLKAKAKLVARSAPPQ